MKSRLKLFLPILSADLSVQEKDYEKIKSLFETAFEISIPEDKHNVNFYKSLIEHEIEVCKNEFHARMCRAECQDEAIAYLEQKHYNLNSYQDHILLKLGEKERYYNTIDEGEVTGKMIFKIIYVALDKFQCYLEKKYEAHLNTDNCISTENYHTSLHEIFNTIDDLQQRLFESIVDRELIAMVRYPLECLSKFQDGHKYKIRELLYYKKFVNVLYGIVEEKKEAIADVDIIEGLFFLNFNSIRFFEYATRFITKEVNNSASIALKIDKLFYFLKRVKHGKLRIVQGFKPEQESIDTMLTKFCIDEIKFFKTSTSVNELPQRREDSSKEVDEVSEPAGKEKVDLNLTVDAIGLLMQGFKNIGVITTRDLAKVYRVVQRSFRSKRSPELSLNSLSSTRYELNDRTRSQLIELAQDLLKYFKQMK